jgi:hypothetical protein
MVVPTHGGVTVRPRMYRPRTRSSGIMRCSLDDALG